MNRQIVRLFGMVVVLFALLVAWTTRWTVLEAKSLRNNTLNVRTLVEELRIKRGRILADDGTVLAQSRPAAGGTWTRFYPTRQLFAQAIGYSIPSQSRAAGLELSRGEELRGLQTGLSSVFGPVSSRRVGDDVYTTLDPKAQRVALSQLGTQAGAVVAIVPDTGAIRVMAAVPGYDDNNPNAVGAGISALNRSTQGQYPPGSTFKLVTATAAVDSGRYTPSSLINGNSPVTISGVPLANDNGQSFGPTTLSDALTYSVNTVFAQVAEALGRSTMTDYMRRFGFYGRPSLDLPPDEIDSSKPYGSSGRPYAPGSPAEDIGRIAIGQGGLRVTPLQMAMVTAAIANAGRLMVPHLTARVVDPDGRTIRTIDPAVESQVMKPASAAAVTQMMRRVVEEGTGTPAQLGGIAVAGKTGTAQVGLPGSGLTQPWFVGFAPIDHPRIAVAVTVERSQGGFGATVAAPIARAVIQTILSEGG